MIRVRTEGIDRIDLKCQAGTLIGQPWKKAFGAVIDYVFSTARARAPRGKTSQLFNKLTETMDSRPLPLWGKVSTDATDSETGFRYPFVLEAGHRARSGHGMAVTKRRRPLTDTGLYVKLHHRGTRRTTRKWLSGSLRGAKKRAEQLLDWAAREIEMNWRA
jgi:hypothetical protein